MGVSPIASIVSFSCRSGLRPARQRIAHFLLFLSPVSATQPSPPNDSHTAVRMTASPGELSLSEEQRDALAPLASFPHGLTEELLVLAHGFDRAMIAGLAKSPTGRTHSISSAALPHMSIAS